MRNVLMKERSEIFQSPIELDTKNNSTFHVNWDNWTNGENYNVAMAKEDFGHIQNFTQEEQTRTLISLSRLRVTLLKNEFGPAGGVITNSNIDPSDNYEINYKVKFHADFDFTKYDGRIGWGLQIGDGNSAVSTGKGGSFRISWARDENGHVVLKPYIYHADQVGIKGESFGAKFPSDGGIEGGKWYDIKMTFIANTKHEKNGVAILSINGQEILNTPIRWTKDDLKRKATELLFANYRDGEGSQSLVSANIWFDDFSIKNNPLASKKWCEDVVKVTSLYDANSLTNYHLTEINSQKAKLRMALSEKIEGETGTEFANRMNCCLAFNASMGIDNPPPGERHPVGIQIVDGTIVQERPTIRYTLGIKDENKLVHYNLNETASNIIKDGSKYALTAFTPLIVNHNEVSDTILSSVPNYKRNTDPRQVIAQFDNGNILVFSSGGRGFGGVGMTAKDVIRILKGKNVRFAFMLDGGGSVTTVVNGTRITPMIDDEGKLERPRPNWLYIKNL